MEVCSSEYRSRRHNKKKPQIIKIETGEMLYYMCGDYVYQVELFNNGHGDVCCIVAGRQVLIDDYKDDFDGIVMCCLPGSEGQGVASVLYGNSNFTGKLPSPWYSSLDQIGTGESWLEIGYGLQY